MDSHEPLERNSSHAVDSTVEAGNAQSRSNSLDDSGPATGQAEAPASNIDVSSIRRPTANLDSFSIAYQDPFGFWTHVAGLFKHLTRFDLKLSRNPKLESLNGQFNAPRAEEHRVAVHCHYVPLESLNLASPAGHANKWSQHASKDSGKKSQAASAFGAAVEKPHAGLDSNQPPHKPKHRSLFKPHEQRSIDTPSSAASVSSAALECAGPATSSAGRAGGKPLDPFGLKTQHPLSQLAEHPYLYLFLVPPSTLAEYKKSVKPRLKEFITRRLENKLNEEFVIVCFTWATKRDAASPVEQALASPDPGVEPDPSFASRLSFSDDMSDSANTDSSAAQLMYPISSDHLSVAGLELAPSAGLDGVAVPKAPLASESITKDLLVSVSVSKQPLEAEIPTKHPLVDESFYRDPALLDPLAGAAEPADALDSDSATSLTSASLTSSSLTSFSLANTAAFPAGADPGAPNPLYDPNARDPAIRHNPSFTSRLSFSSRHSFTSRPSFTNECIYAEALGRDPLDSEEPGSGLGSPKRALSLSRLSSNNLAEVLKRHEFISKNEPDSKRPPSVKSKFNLKKLGFGKLAVLAKPMAGLARPKSASPKEGEDRRVVERIRLSLFKHKLRSRIVVIPIDPAIVQGTENADATASSYKNTDALLISAIRESGINKMMSSLINLSVNKRYLYILIHVNKLFLPFITTTRTSGSSPTAAAIAVNAANALGKTTAGTRSSYGTVSATATPQGAHTEASNSTAAGTSPTGAAGAELGANADPSPLGRQSSVYSGRLGTPGATTSSAVAASMHAIIGNHTVGGYLEFVDALECLANLFFKLHLVLESVFLYEFLLYNDNFARLLGLFRSTTVERSFFSHYNALISYCSSYYSALRTNLFTSDHQLNVGRFCYVRYRLYILSKQLLMLSSGGYTGAAESAERYDRLSPLGNRGTGSDRNSPMDRRSTVDRVSIMNRTSGSFVGVSTLPASAGSAGSGDNALLLSVLLIYNFMNDAYFQVVGNVSTSSSYGPSDASPTAVAATASADLSRIKWLVLVALELVRHIENRLNAESLEEELATESFLGEVVERKRKKFSFFKSLFAHHGSGRGASRGAPGAVGASSGAASLLDMVDAYYGLKHLESAFKYVSFIYLVLYKLVLHLHRSSASSGAAPTNVTTDTITIGSNNGNTSTNGNGNTSTITNGNASTTKASTNITHTTTIKDDIGYCKAESMAGGAEDMEALRERKESEFDAYIESLNDNCLRLHYSCIEGLEGLNATAPAKGTGKPNTARTSSISGTVGATGNTGTYNTWKSIDSLLERVVEHRVAIIERCSKYFILSNMQRHSSVIRSYYLGRTGSLSRLDTSEAASLGGSVPEVENASTTQSGATRASRSLSTLGASQSIESDRTAATEQSAPSLAPGTRVVATDRPAADAPSRRRSGLADRGARLSRISANYPLGSVHPDDMGASEQNERIVCSLVRCNEYDHLYSKSYRASSSSSLSLYPNCHNYVHICLVNTTGAALEHVRLFLSTSALSPGPAITENAQGAGSSHSLDTNSSSAPSDARSANKPKTPGAPPGDGTDLPESPLRASGLEIDLYELTLINVDNRIVNLAVYGSLDPSSRLGSALHPGLLKGACASAASAGIKLPSFSNKMVLCVPIKLVGLSESLSPDLSEIRLNVSVTAVTTASSTSSASTNTGANTNNNTATTGPNSTTTTTTNNNTNDGGSSPDNLVKTTKSYSVRVREIFEVRLSEAKGVKSIYLRVQYRDLVKIHQIYLNNHIIAGTTLLDYNSIYKIVYQPGQSVTSTTTNTPTSRDASATDAPKQPDDGKAVDPSQGSGVQAQVASEGTHSASGEQTEDAEDVIRIYYSLYRKHRSSLQQVTHNQLYLIRPACLVGTDSDSPSAAKAGEHVDPLSSRRSQQSIDTAAEPAETQEPCAQLVMKVPGYAFVSKGITLSLWLLSDTTLTFSYSIDGNQSWFIEGLVVNNNVVLTKGKRYGLQFRLIPLREGRLEVPAVRFRGLRVDVPRREVTVFPTNYLLL